MENQEKAPAGAPAGKLAYMAHFVVRTSKFRETVDWYRIFFDAKDVFVSDEITFLTFDEEHHRVAIAYQPNLADFTEDRAGIDHVAFNVASLGDLIAAYERLKDKGVMPIFPINHGPTTSLYYLDPNGIKVEIQVDNMSLEGGPASFFKTEAFAKNPVGVMFDPEILARKFREGVDENELLQQGSTAEA